MVKTIYSDDEYNSDPDYATLSWAYLDSPNTSSEVTYYIKYKTYDPSSMGAPTISLLDAQITIQETGSGGAAAGGHDIVEESGSALTTRTKLTFIGELAEAVDNAVDDSTDILINAKTSWLYG